MKIELHSCDGEPTCLLCMQGVPRSGTLDELRAVLGLSTTATIGDMVLKVNDLYKELDEAHNKVNDLYKELDEAHNKGMES
jgi:hypothetical protein